MRPIELRFAGLNSYRQEQIIDFTVLGAANLFGVFGPTGAGKSTILDAITLALFSKVGRAHKGTQAIINQQENETTVSFKFSLGSGERKEVFQVERRYRRNKSATATEFSAKSVTSRLVRLCGESGQPDSVLADQDEKVNNKIEEFLGLDLKDFSRAVALPQGKLGWCHRASSNNRCCCSS